MESDIKVNCATHGETDAAFVCQHLASGERLGFNCVYRDEQPDAMCPDAWCNECEAGLDTAGEWTEEMMARADIKLVCTSCYGTIRHKNWIGDDASYLRLRDEASAYLDDRLEAFKQEFGVGNYERYDYDQERAQLVFSNDGKPGVICDVTFVGSVAPRPGTWLWSWANSSLTEAAKARMREVRVYGEKHGLERLAGALWAAEEPDGWEMTAIAAYLLNGIGAYRSPGEKSRLFMVILKATRAQ